MTTLVLLGALAAQAAPSAKVDIVSVTGCLKEATANNWTLTGATDPVPSSANAPAAKDIPKAPPSGRNAFKLIGCVATIVGVHASPAPAAATLVPTFTKDVAPIVFNKCASCHRKGEVAPMTLTSYEDVRPWAKVIKNKVVSREMPPWFADAAH